MFSRSRSFATLALSALVVAGLLTSCAKQKDPKAEIRLPRTSLSSADEGWDNANASTTNAAEGEGGALSYGTDTWGPGGAPPETGSNSDFSMTRSDDFMAGDDIVETAFLDEETGSLANTASTDGVEDGTFSAELDMVYFPFDSSEINGENVTTLENHASWLSENPEIMVQVEGHTDERGTEEYNISLGQRRADSVREFLVEQGIEPNRISTISYGKMRPMSFGTEESDHALNRRAMFLVYEMEDSTVASAF